MPYLVVAAVWIICILLTISVAKSRGAHPLATIFFLLLTGTTGPIGLVLVYMFMPSRR